MEDLLERWRGPIILVLIGIIVAGLAVIYLRWPRSSSSDSSVLPGKSLPSGSLLITTPTLRPASLKVQVAGAVARPGVYAFRDGDRVEEALKAAGGPLPDADLSRVNQAQRLRDEGYILVPRLNETPVAGAVAPAAGAQTPASPAASGKVNINTASVAQLDTLPGIGATYSQRIVDYRSKNGPFQTTKELVDNKLVPQSTFDKIKDLIDVK